MNLTQYKLEAGSQPYAALLIKVFGPHYPNFRPEHAARNLRLLSAGNRSKVLAAITRYGLWSYHHNHPVGHAEAFKLLQLTSVTAEDLLKLRQTPNATTSNPVITWRFKVIFYYLSLVYPDVAHLYGLDKATIQLLAHNERPTVSACFSELLSFSIIPSFGPVLARVPGKPFTQANFSYYCNALGEHLLGRKIRPTEIERGFFAFGGLL